jgi:hypothetical protein
MAKACLHLMVAAILNGVPEAVADKPTVSCLMGAWLVKARNPVRFVVAELLAMADDGLLTVHADDIGYTLRVHADWDRLGAGRRAILTGLARGGPEVLLPRPPDDPDDDGRLKGSLLSFDSLVTAVAREGEATGMASRTGWLLVDIGIAALGGVIASFVLGVPVVGYVLGVGIGLLASWWNARRIQPSRKGRAERDRVLALRRVLGAEAAPIAPAAAAPAWWSWTGEAPPTFISHKGIFGLILAVRYSMCP